MIQNRDQLTVTRLHEVTLDCIEAGIEAAQPKNAVANALSLSENILEIQNRTIDLSQFTDILILGGGKAAAQMAQALEQVLSDWISGGVVVTNDPRETMYTEVFEGSHPIPDVIARDGAEEILSLARQADEDTLILFLLSGGGSALLPLPDGNISLSDLQLITEELLACGATIDEINTIRKHISRIKGGEFAVAAAPATVGGLVISDVVGNDLDVIASGPIVGDESTFQDALSVLEAHDIDAPVTVKDHLTRGKRGEIDETPTTNEPVFERVSTHILADPTTAIEAAMTAAERTDFTPLLLSTRVEGEAREVGKVHAAIANEIIHSGRPIEPPAILLSGGETTVTIRGDGHGGPNQEFALSGLLQNDFENIVIGAVDTDGEDGATDAAGAIGDTTIIDLKSTAKKALLKNDTYDYFKARQSLIHTGPTGTNVNDLRVIAIPEQQ